jgi:putative glycosyltransferase (TIGR04372 family)
MSIKDKIYMLLWPEKLLTTSYFSSIYSFIRDNSRDKGLFCNANVYLLLKVFYSSVSNIVFLPISLLLYVANYRFIYGTRFQQLGEIFTLDIAIKSNKLNNNSKLILFFYPPFHDNSYFLSLYKEHVIFVDKAWLIPILLPLSQSIITRMDVVNFDSIGKGETSKIFKKFYTQYNEPLVRMSFDDIEKCEALVSKYINKDQKIVCIHARESGFKDNYYKDSNRTTRNADINSYDLLIDKLIDLGYVVFRLGDPWMQRVPYLLKKYKENFVDYAHSNIKSEKMDIYLLSHCNFLVGCSSGPSEISTIFNINTLLLNGYSAVKSLRCMKGDISIFKKITNIKTGKVVGLHSLFSDPFDKDLQIKNLNNLGYELINNSRQEVVEALEDFLIIKNQPEKIDMHSKSCQDLFKEYHYGYNSSGRFSKSFIDNYISNEIKE